ncbi:hypothetical protein BdWA1_001172 [Babesia duncani]|uniref:Uncharacterized protein n=1 Tax=Babesia duncani TaxID=323732 RepID=A0AAD9PPE0_9APIC|nr:hypothetical protein BdWA1_001172 [Babesia duncani]
MWAKKKKSVEAQVEKEFVFVTARPNDEEPNIDELIEAIKSNEAVVVTNKHPSLQKNEVILKFPKNEAGLPQLEKYKLTVLQEETLGDDVRNQVMPLEELKLGPGEKDIHPPLNVKGILPKFTRDLMKIKRFPPIKDDDPFLSFTSIKRSVLVVTVFIAVDVILSLFS